MRIIDKQHDFYDYLQDPTDSLVFDRRGSFLLTREIFCQGIRYQQHFDKSRYRFVLLQCGVTYWLFLVTITAKTLYDAIEDYELTLLEHWKNYDRSNHLIRLCMVSFHLNLWNYRINDMDIDTINARVNDLKNAIDQGNYYIERDIGHYTNFLNYKGAYKETKQNLPILKACGMAKLIDPVTIFYAIEEHFSMKKTASETIEARGTTNEDKIAMHGFNVKTSFRNMDRK